MIAPLMKLPVPASEQARGSRAGETDLPPEALAKMVVHAGFGWGIFSGSLYNGNSDYALTQITVLLTPMKKSDAAQAPAEGREYDIALAVQPLSKAALSLPSPQTILSNTPGRSLRRAALKQDSVALYFT